MDEEVAGPRASSSSREILPQKLRPSRPRARGRRGEELALRDLETAQNPGDWQLSPWSGSGVRYVGVRLDGWAGAFPRPGGRFDGAGRRGRQLFVGPGAPGGMGELHPRLTPELADFLGRQRVFFVATAPLSKDQHVNISPKGLDTLRILSLEELAYLDLTGSGNETSAHVHENARMTVMACAFNGPPNVLRIYGKGEVHLPGSPRWDELRPLFPDLPGARQIISLRIERVQTSCGYAVPLLEYKEDRSMLTKWASVKGPIALDAYRVEKNTESIDGLVTHFGERRRSLPSDPTAPP